jgi:hypothetical protein
MSFNDCIIFVITLMQFMNEVVYFYIALTKLRSSTSLLKVYTIEVIKKLRYILNSF